ncbi:hypothetical protein LX69_01128 [Breznakibacter xylanolyticus]|uniref:Uncharacterized protein n=1 Tax=Breznakibacter xylanolyticus TaxID=990 RepID=A0A2W7NCI9_9BACT|nr:hypothetical protein [Breznakibacter xylanolyticus]PZX18091.1 hypothetical protein LX69_01128 [Breznakibacter xylanolyticus]
MKENRINYKRVYQRLAEKYPSIADELKADAPKKLDGLEMLTVFTIFCRIKGITHLNLPPDSEKSHLQALFASVFVQIYDSDYFQGDKRPLRKGLRQKMAALLNCHATQISHILSSVKIYLKAYKSFRSEAEYIYNEISKTLSNGNKVGRKELSETQ